MPGLLASVGTAGRVVAADRDPRGNYSRNPFARIVSLAAVGDGNRVLDLGCGRGNTVPCLLAGVGTAGRVAAADRDLRSLAALAAAHAAAVASGRLSIVDLDVRNPLPFASATFDSIVCQNVIECITERGSLLREIYRILKPGGTALVGHHDFDGVLIANDDQKLTRRLVHGYADHAQAWQDASEGQMGRLLPGLFASTPFEDVETGTLLFVDLALSDESYGRIHLDGIVALSKQFGISADDAKSWLAAQEVRSDAGTFYYALPWTYVIARRL